METSGPTFSGTERAAEAVARYDVAAAAAGRRRARYAAGTDRRRASRRATSKAAIEAIEAKPDGDERREAEVAFLKREDAGKRAAEAAQQEKELVRQRLRDGFVQDVPTYVACREVEPFREEGLRSERWGDAAKLFLRGLPKKGSLRTGRDNAVMLTKYRSKLLSCDEPYIEGTRSMVSLLRVDLDRDHDVEALRASLQALVDSSDLPCMPHFVVGREEQRVDTIDELLAGDLGRSFVERPHLWWVIPDAVAVMQAPPRKPKKGETKAEPRSPIRKKPVRLLDAVYRGIVSVLVPLGVDPKAKWRLVRGKNPLSPFWWAECWNQTSFPSLSEHADVLGKERLCKTIEELTRDAAAQVTESRSASNAFFDVACKLAWSTLKGWHASAWGPYLKTLEGLPDEDLKPLLRQRLTVSAVVEADDAVDVPRRAERVLDLVAGYAARAWSPERADAIAERSRRGRLSHLTEGVRSLSERQAIAAKATASGRANAAQERIIRAMDSVERSGAPFTQVEVARVSGLNRKTVGKHWRFCLSRRPRRCLDKKNILNPGSSTNGSAMPAPCRPVPSTLCVVTHPPSRTVPVRAAPAATGAVSSSAIPESMVSRPPARDVPARAVPAESARFLRTNLGKTAACIAPGMLDASKRREAEEPGAAGISTADSDETRQARKPGVFGPGCEGWPPRPPAKLFWRGGLPSSMRGNTEEMQRRINARLDGLRMVPSRWRMKAE